MCMHACLFPPARWVFHEAAGSCPKMLFRHVGEAKSTQTRLCRSWFFARLVGSARNKRSRGRGMTRMSQSGAYGKEFASRFGLDDAPAIVTRVLRKAEVAVTEVRSDNPRIGMTDALHREDAFLVGLQLRDYPGHQMFED